MPTLYGSFCRVDLADGVIVAMADATTVRVCPAPDASTRADLAADVARLERSIADLTRERDGLRSRLDGQAAHGAAGEGVDLAAVLAVADGAIDRALYTVGLYANVRRTVRAAVEAALREALIARHPHGGHLRSEAVEGGEHKGVEGGDHGATVATDAAGRKGPTL